MYVYLYMLVCTNIKMLVGPDHESDATNYIVNTNIQNTSYKVHSGP